MLEPRPVEYVLGCQWVACLSTDFAKAARQERAFSGVQSICPYPGENPDLIAPRYLDDRTNPGYCPGAAQLTGSRPLPQAPELLRSALVTPTRSRCGRNPLGHRAWSCPYCPDVASSPARSPRGTPHTWPLVRLNGCESLHPRGSNPHPWRLPLDQTDG